MSARVAKLEGLLERVQVRRAQPRPVAAAAAPASGVVLAPPYDEDDGFDDDQETIPPGANGVPPGVEPVQADEMSFADLSSAPPPPAEAGATGASLEDAMEQYASAAPPAVDEAAPVSSETAVAPVLEAVPEVALAEDAPLELDTAPAEMRQSAGGLEVDLGSLKQEADAGGGKLRPITLPDADDGAPAVPTAATARIAHQAPDASGPVTESIGQAPSSAGQSFGELIAASLSLKPRG